MSVRQDYRTTDLYLAAYLKAAGLAFEGTTKVSGRTYFIFENNHDVRDLKNSYFSREGKVSALDYADELRALKSLCFA